MITHTLVNKLFQSAEKNPLLHEVLVEEGIGDVFYASGRSILFSFQGESPWFMKYIAEENPRKRSSLLRFSKQGIEKQKKLQGIAGIQDVQKSEYYRGVEGLFGPFLYSPGDSLDKKVLDAEECFLLSKKVEGILWQMHSKGILHRDIKPGNLVFGKGEISLIDFGLAASFQEHLKDMRSYPFFGSPGFIPCDVSRCRDFYGLGMSFFALLFSDIFLPFGGSETFLQSCKSHVYLRYGKNYAQYFEDLTHKNFLFKKASPITLVPDRLCF